MLKTPHEIDCMREAGKVQAKALQLCRELAVPGITTKEIDLAVEALYTKHNVTPVCKDYPSHRPGIKPFPACMCISVNDEVVHGIPSQRKLCEGDLVKFDTTCKLNNWCADAAITIPIGKVSEAKAKLLRITKEALDLAISEMVIGKKWSEIAVKIGRYAYSNNFSVVQEYAGHGIGQNMHEEPVAPNQVSTKKKPWQNFTLQEGLVLAIEPIFNMGSAKIRTLSDGWTAVTEDGLASAHFEHTLAIGKDGAMVITQL